MLLFTLKCRVLALGGIAGGAVALVGGCTFDFDAPFAGGASGGGGPVAATSGSTTGGGEGAGPVSSSSGPGGPGGGGPGGGGNEPAAEDCGNGVDDDANGAVDCADAACVESGWTCADAVPDGFEGPVALARGGPASPPSCGGAFSQLEAEGGMGLEVDPPSCTDCTCGAPLDRECVAELRLYLDEACANLAGTVAVAGSDCTTTDDPLLFSVSASPPTPMGGACDPLGGDHRSDPARFAETVKLCATQPGGGCSGAACVTAPPPPFDPQLCVYTRGSASCEEAGPYSVEITIHEAIDDARGCTPCACSAPDGGACAGQTKIYANNGSCNGQSVTLGHDGSCRTSFGFESFEAALQLTGGACTAAGGAAFGVATLVDPVTVCCLP